MKMKYRLASVLALGCAIAAWGQQSTPPPAKPADSGPTLAATMQFIQEKLSEQGQVGWAEIYSNQPQVTRRRFVQLTDVMADPAACTLYTTETNETNVDLPKGSTYKLNGKPVNDDDLRTHIVETDTVSFKQVEKVTVEFMVNRALGVPAHPEISARLTPPVFYVKLWASSAVFSIHGSITTGKLAPVEKDDTSKIMGYYYRDNETANKVAKAMTHAMELCGGGVTKKDIF
jgi:hypothetical protein